MWCDFYVLFWSRFLWVQFMFQRCRCRSVWRWLDKRLKIEGSYHWAGDCSFVGSCMFCWSSTLRLSVMEKFSVNYSTKNIPLPSQNDYRQRLIEKTEQFLRRMRWKAYFFLNPGTISNTKDTYGFKEFENDNSLQLKALAPPEKAVFFKHNAKCFWFFNSNWGSKRCKSY